MADAAPEWFPPVGSLVELAWWEGSRLVVVSYEPTKKEKKTTWRLVLTDPLSGADGWLPMRWEEGEVIVHPPEGETYALPPQPTAGWSGELPEGLALFSSAIKPKKLRQFYRMLQKNGYEVFFTKNHHIGVKCPEGIVYGPSTSSDPRSWKHVKSDCVRHGIPREVFNGW